MLPKRFARFGLHIHPEKTALIAFRKPQGHQETSKGNGTFDFLGLTHYWSRSRRGYWVIKRRTASKRSPSHQEVVVAMVSRQSSCAREMTSIRCSARSCVGISSTMVFEGTSVCWRRSRRYTEKAWQYWLSRRSEQELRSVGRSSSSCWRRMSCPTPKIVHNI